MNRRESFRALINRLDPAGDPARLRQLGQYIERYNNQISVTIARWFDLEPHSCHLAAGGIGTGKTTELHRCRDLIQMTDSTSFTEVIDVTLHHDIAHGLSGVIVGLVGLRLIEAVRGKGVLPKDLRSPADLIRRHAQGFWASDDGSEDPDDGTYWVSGALKTPRSDNSFEDLVAALAVLRQAVAPDSAPCIFLFDGLDRSQDPRALLMGIRDDLKTLRECGIGTVIAAPIIVAVHSASYKDYFDSIHLQPYLDPNESTSREFLNRVIDARDTDNLIQGDARELLSISSGGALRDLLQLAKRAAQQAYIQGAEMIEKTHVAEAAISFGRDLLIGVTKDQLAILTHLASGAEFSITGRSEEALVVSRRVLLYAPRKWTVHPTVMPFLNEQTKATP